MLGPDTTTEEETQPDKEPKNSSTPTFTPPHSPSKENSEDSTMKKGRSPDSSPSTPEFTAFAEDPRLEMDNMSGESSSTLKQEQKPRTQEEMMISVATAVLEEVGKKEKKEKRAKVAALEPFEGDRTLSGLPFTLADKILNQPQGRPADLEGWYKAAIRFDEQFKYAKAIQKPRRFQMARDKKKRFEKKEVAIN
ncbi:hypothetical protein Moror_4832 [Moniliophthora roreri MCA 2997]|uniref:Uncharacterized protein n=1 Tax=Moniliophthora roreri (strain MCA 2997) TaxID=1381753 RepID=V2XH96_MONRO|nr:hypothetical protein Moror_4832 [Moniliophthora roreri MCA 2997]